MRIYINNKPYTCKSPQEVGLRRGYGWYECKLYDEKNIPVRIARLPIDWFDEKETRAIYTGGEWASKKPMESIAPPSKG